MLDVKTRRMVHYRTQAGQAGVSPQMATVLNNIARSLPGLASQHEVLAAIGDEERRQPRS
ncbi:hypothetical protein [Bradyrhizobium sp. McL0616]|uniref:hypothetical protein n=1 Tax=Bradyrhizobium sp. McL0616 TaxID=3415674 RepID=UPI003CF330F7